jgi:hypothetical protein
MSETQEHSFITPDVETADLLIAMIDNWIEGLPTAEAATIQDRSITSVEDLLDLSAGYVAQRERLTKYRQLLEADRERYEYGP